MSQRQTSVSFWEKIKKGSGCWEWQGALNSTGYGNVSWHGKVYTAHRVAAWLVGLIAHPSAPRNKQDQGYVLHTCDNRKCCNPKHFFLGSYSDNQFDAYKKNRKRQPKGENHANAKLTLRQIAAIRKEYAAGKSQSTLASKYGVSQTSVSKIVRNETYK